MAYFGISKPIIAKYNGETEKYSEAIELEAAGTSVTPAFSEGSFYCDNRLGIHRKLFKQADITAEIKTIPLAAGELLFGHTIDTSKKEETAKTNDKSNYVGYGFVGCEAIDDERDVYTACWLPKVLFTEGEDSYTTQNDSITFTAQKISGVAVGAKDKTWREKAQFDTEDEAYSWLKTKAGIVAA
jgi:hypothetical protein|nr:MAG TPA: tail tube protein [Caudoviricetes sp.]